MKRNKEKVTNETPSENCPKNILTSPRKIDLGGGVLLQTIK